MSDHECCKNGLCFANAMIENTARQEELAYWQERRELLKLKQVGLVETSALTARDNEIAELKAELERKRINVDQVALMERLTKERDEANIDQIKHKRLNLGHREEIIRLRSALKLGCSCRPGGGVCVCCLALNQKLNPKED